MWEAVTGTLGIEDWGVVRPWKPGRIPRGANYEVEMRWQDIYRVTLGSVTLGRQGRGWVWCSPQSPHQPSRESRGPGEPGELTQLGQEDRWPQDRGLWPRGRLSQLRPSRRGRDCPDEAEMGHVAASSTVPSLHNRDPTLPPSWRQARLGTAPRGLWAQRHLQQLRAGDGFAKSLHTEL